MGDPRERVAREICGAIGGCFHRGGCIGHCERHDMHEGAAAAIAECFRETEKMRALVDAAQNWGDECEGLPGGPSDARLMQALWLYEGDRLEPCPECDGECGEPCAPTTAASAIAALDRWTADWNKRHGITQLPPSPGVAVDAGGGE